MEFVNPVHQINIISEVSVFHVHLIQRIQMTHIIVNVKIKRNGLMDQNVLMDLKWKCNGMKMKRN